MPVYVSPSPSLTLSTLSPISTPLMQSVDTLLSTSITTSSTSSSSSSLLAIVPGQCAHNAVLGYNYRDFVDDSESHSGRGDSSGSKRVVGSLLHWYIVDHHRCKQIPCTSKREGRDGESIDFVQTVCDDDLLRTGYLEYQDSDLVTTVDLSTQGSLLKNIVAALPYLEMNLSLTLPNGGKSLSLSLSLSLLSLSLSVSSNPVSCSLHM